MLSVFKDIKGKSENWSIFAGKRNLLKNNKEDIQKSSNIS